MGITSRETKAICLFIFRERGLLIAAAMMAAGWDGMDSNQSVQDFPGMGNGKLNGKESIQCRKIKLLLTRRNQFVMIYMKYRHGYPMVFAASGKFDGTNRVLLDNLI